MYEHKKKHNKINKKKNQNSGLSDVKQINERFIDSRILCTNKKHGTLWIGSIIIRDWKIEQKSDDESPERKKTCVLWNVNWMNEFFAA